MNVISFMLIAITVSDWDAKNTTIAIVAASRLVFAVARDGVLPFSGWVSRVSANGQPHNAILVVWGVAAGVTCTILPSTVAFTSLVSAAGVPSAAAYGLICLGRVFLTPNKFPKPRWSLGRLSRPFQIIGIFWNAWVVAVLFSPYQFPVTDAPIILSGVTIFALVSYWIIPEEKWFPNARITKFVDQAEPVQPIHETRSLPNKSSGGK
ncbi:amino acid permease [Coccidioides immitis H538.4]|uniref:Amino acid permease n=1 Tax=Coccidioides immitis H538.4 TaxID=396776 RepID=A0A0J8U7T7_COCIT|nr:amino acid permease [Coccidioides immitis H538.4]